MGLALSSSHHYCSRPRVRAQSDKHSSCSTLQLILFKALKRQRHGGINRSKSRSNYRIKNPSQSWHSLQNLAKYEAASQSCAPRFPRQHHPCWNTAFLCGTSPLVSTGQARRHNTFIVCWQTCEVCRCFFFLNLYSKMVFTSVRWNHAVCWVYPDVLLLLKPVHRGHLKADQEEAKFLPFSFLTVEGILQTPSDCEIHLWRDDTPPDGSRLTWFAHYNFAYENKMRCDNWSLMYFSLLSHDTISTALFQGKTLLGRAHLKLL